MVGALKPRTSVQRVHPHPLRRQQLYRIINHPYLDHHHHLLTPPHAPWPPARRTSRPSRPSVAERWDAARH